MRRGGSPLATSGGGRGEDDYDGGALRWRLEEGRVKLQRRGRKAGVVPAAMQL